MREADNFTSFMCRSSRNLGALTSRNPLGLVCNRPVQGLLYLLPLYMNWYHKLIVIYKIWRVCQKVRYRTKQNEGKKGRLTEGKTWIEITQVMKK